MEGSLANLIPRLVKEGVFGDVELMDMKFTKDEEIGAHFASNLAFVTLNLKGTIEECLQIFVKTPVSHRRDSLSLFQTELLMYKEVLPATGFSQKYYPKFYYGIVDHENPENSVLIFENLKYRKYINSEKQIFLNYDHILLVIKNIAKFHSLSYVLKHENAEKFQELTKKMKNHGRKLSESLKKFSNVPAQMAIRAFEEEHGNEELLDKFSSVLENSDQLMEHLTTSLEPFAVICHGDFCNNNVMYKYDRDGSPIDCAFVDFQMSKYSSIVTDISFFLYLNTDIDIREQYWDQLLNIYWETLRENVPNHIDLPCFKSFLEHFAQFAVYGFNISSLFLPVLMDPLSFDKIVDVTIEESDKRRSHKDQEIGSKVKDMVSHLYHKEYLQAFLDYMTKIETES